MVGPYCDKDDRIWVPLEISSGPSTDAFVPRVHERIIVSKDKGLSWEFSDLKYPQDWPGPRSDRVTLAQGTIVEAGHFFGFERHPRSQIKRLEKEGYDVWDLGVEESYCAIIYAMWIRRSTDCGKSWEEIPLHTRFLFFARLLQCWLARLDDATILNFCYGHKLASSDAGQTGDPFLPDLDLPQQPIQGLVLG